MRMKSIGILRKHQTNQEPEQSGPLNRKHDTMEKQKVQLVKSWYANKEVHIKATEFPISDWEAFRQERIDDAKFIMNVRIAEGKEGLYISYIQDYTNNLLSKHYQLVK